MTIDSAAESALKCGAELRPTDPVMRNNLGCIVRSLGKQVQAEEEFREAVRLRPGYTSAEVNLGGSLNDAGDFAGAERVLRAALVAAPNNPEAHNNLGSALQQMGRADEATACYETAVSLRPDYADALTNLGMARIFDNRLVDAEDCLRKALVIASGHVVALYYLGFLLYKRNAIPEAEQCFQSILDIDPGHENAAYLLSVIGISEAPPRSPVGYVKELFDGYADKFDEHLVGTLKYSAPAVMSRLVHQALGENASLVDILDLGCGTGLCAQYFTDVAKSLVGVDISERMLEKAGALNIYTCLERADLASFLSAQEESYDLILSGDVFVYIGDLSEVFPACVRALRKGGLMSFSIELSEIDQPYTLRKSGRYAHSPDYVSQLAGISGLRIVVVEEIVIREEFCESIAGQVYVLTRDADMN